MSTHIAKQAIVVGAGIGGLATARVLSDHFEQVTLLDSDTLPPDGSPRRGIPQGGHVHALLAGGLRALADLLPDLEQDLVRGGAVRVRLDRDLKREFPGSNPFPQRDLGIDIYAQSRPMLEAIVRQQVCAVSNVQLDQRTRVQRLTSRDSGRRVKGLVCAGSDGKSRELEADLIVDASGRGRLTLSYLEEAGYPLPDATTIGVDIGYSTAVFEVPRDAPSEWKGVYTFPRPPENSCAGLLLPMEDGCWIMTLGGLRNEAPPGDADGFFAYARNLHSRTIHDAISGAKQVREIVRFRFKENTHRHFASLPSFPPGLLPIGDSICRFNPIYGQGMTVAAQEARALGQVLSERAREPDPLEGLAEAVFAAADRIIETPWRTAALSDLAYPDTRGERPPDFERQFQRSVALIGLMAEDAEVHRVVVEVVSLLSPHAALEEPWLTKRLDEFVARAQERKKTR